jgi:hypothetical protein
LIALPTLKITVEHIQDGTYNGPLVSDYGGNLEIAADLGCIIFPGSIRAQGFIKANEGSGITATESIYAGMSIQVALDIKASLDIEAAFGIESGKNINAGCI